MLGKIFIERDCDTSSGKIEFDIGNLSSGIYIVRLNTVKKNVVSKVIVFRY
ncbi:MAG: T9SS type A sorting domain-containing protein [Bacteroidia bacterium]|nr:T9SS type A sorting domain-containing protein [Bacteroidia bacterium]